MKYIVIRTTTNKKIIADKISNILINQKLSPCIQITSKIISNYIWNGQFKSETEYSIQIKSILRFKDEIKDIIIKLHNYNVPEITFIDMHIINDQYKAWYNECLKK